MRRFELHRDVDVSGVSDVGIVADGVVFDRPVSVQYQDGKVLSLPAGWVRLTWRGELTSTSHWTSLSMLEAVHGHSGLTRVVFLDDDEAVL